MRVTKLSSQEIEARRNRKRFHCTLDDKTFKRLDKLSELLGISKSEIIDKAIKAYFKHIIKKLGADKNDKEMQ